MFRECLLLVKNGVPFDVAFSMSDGMRMAACIVYGELEGNEWLWPQMRWKEK